MRELTKNERIAARKAERDYQDRKTRSVETYSERFNRMFSFFLNSYRKGLLNFGGELFIIKTDLESFSAKACFRWYDNGYFTSGKAMDGKSYKEITTKHPNIVRAVVIAKKSWGLHLKLWKEGIKEGTFRKDEILEAFENRGVTIPEAFMKEFKNMVISAYEEPLKKIKDGTTLG